ncbi:unnamed protein product [Ambrosiozyma monospora]|uniref:Unnamed protein product n=1 Tax=Ambrosiozyma monospora TaxID=43982 RepID=A0ACB5SSJ7_AMBMO|nr:unnamed protein product [Ambrosiozyma monospora]
MNAFEFCRFTREPFLRGRPRKVADLSEPVQPKKRRGRPKKVEDSVAVGESTLIQGSSSSITGDSSIDLDQIVSGSSTDAANSSIVVSNVDPVTERGGYRKFDYKNPLNYKAIWELMNTEKLYCSYTPRGSPEFSRRRGRVIYLPLHQKLQRGLQKRVRLGKELLRVLESQQRHHTFW